MANFFFKLKSAAFFHLIRKEEGKELTNVFTIMTFVGDISKRNRTIK